MNPLYLTSVEAAGKTALCLGIGKKLLQEGKKVGFFRPVRLSELSPTDGYKDALFIKEALGLGEPLDILSPIVLSRRDLWHNLATDTESFKQKLKQAYNRISLNKDAVVMEGLSELTIDKVTTEACYQIADALDARVIIVLRYSQALVVPEVTEISQRLGQRLLGVVVNYVPKPKIKQITDDIKTLFGKEGTKVLSVIPEDRTLLGVSVGELAKILNGEIMTHPEAETEIVENIMLGAMSPDLATDYFGRKTNKAAVIRGERADMQLAALQTSTKCLILTGNVPPTPTILNEAEIKVVPIIAVKQNTVNTIAGIEEALKQARFHSLKKLEKFSQILEQYFDFQTLYHGLGLRI